MKNLILVAAAVLPFPTAAHAEWHTASSNHFEVYAEAPEDYVRDYAEMLERFDGASRRLRSFPENPFPGSNKVTVYVVSPGLYSKIGPKGSGGFYSGSANGSSIFIPNNGNAPGKDETLFHEYTHHLLAVAWSGIALPGWLNEGQAQVASTAEFKSDGSVVFGRELKGSEYYLRGLEDADVRRMVTSSTIPTGERIYYSGGWLLAHMLTFGDKRSGQLSNYIVAVNKGMSTQEAAEQAFGDLSGLTRDMGAYRRRGALPGVVIPASDLTVGSIDVRALSPAEEAAMPVVIESRSGVTKEEAPAIFEDAKAVAARFPDDAFVQRALAEAAYDADDFDTALAASDASIETGQAPASAYAYKVRAMNELDRDADSLRAVIEQGLAQHPDSAELLSLFYQTYTDAGEQPSDRARQRMIQAYKIAPQDGAVRMRTGQMLLASGDGNSARAVLRPLAFSVHRSKAAERALSAIKAIESGDAQTAISDLEAPADEDEEATEE